MNGKDAKNLSKQALGVGCFSVNDPWVSSKDLVTDKPIIIGTHHGEDVAGKDPVKYYVSPDGKKIGDFILQTDDKKGYDKKRYSVITNIKDGKFLCVVMRQREFINTHNCLYYYRTTPSFEGQEPFEETIASLKGVGKAENQETSMTSSSSKKAEQEDPMPYDNEPLYLWARLVSVTRDDGPQRALASLCKGVDPDMTSGYLWKAMYRAVQKPQFQYEAVVLDMQGNIVCKSKQRSSMDNSGMYEIAPKADILWVLIACQRLIPDGSKIFDGMEIALDLTLLI